MILTRFRAEGEYFKKFMVFHKRDTKISRTVILRVVSRRKSSQTRRKTNSFFSPIVLYCEQIYFWQCDSPLSENNMFAIMLSRFNLKRNFLCLNFCKLAEKLHAIRMAPVSFPVLHFPVKKSVQVSFVSYWQNKQNNVNPGCGPIKKKLVFNERTLWI